MRNEDAARDDDRLATIVALKIVIGDILASGSIDPVALQERTAAARVGAILGTSKLTNELVTPRETLIAQRRAGYLAQIISGNWGEFGEAPKGN